MRPLSPAERIVARASRLFGGRRGVYWLAALVLIVPLSGCASAAPRQGDLAPILPASESRLETASPTARDALDEGLRWIVGDAPGTRVESGGEETPEQGAAR